MGDRRKSERDPDSNISSLRRELEFFQTELNKKLRSVRDHLTLDNPNDPDSIPHLEKIVRFFQKQIEVESIKQSLGIQIGLEKGKELFDKELERLHIASKIGLWKYFKKIGPAVIAVSPVIYSGIFFIALLDLYVIILQYVCFPAYGITRAERKGYFIFERMYAKFLNFVQKVNCGYCSYGNGLVAYSSEILNRSEFLWRDDGETQRGSFAQMRRAGFVKCILAVVWYAGVPIIMLFDAFITLYQHICFRVYRLPIVERGRYVSFKNCRLSGPNFIQAANYSLGTYCVGVISYACEIFSLTESFWCPIKHAKNLLGYHDRYDVYAEFGNPDEFFQKYMKAHGKASADTQ
ncbi:MAG: hypothetical protein WCT49_02455 [Candidatus Paceibacterota bacterium]|nr:hypothetical protein [Candidatus Paceibacterota bacterium]